MKHQFAYVCKFEVRSHDIVYSWNIITYKQIYRCMTSRDGANIRLLQEYSYLRKQVRSHDTVSKVAYVSKCVHVNGA